MSLCHINRSGSFFETQCISLLTSTVESFCRQCVSCRTSAVELTLQRLWLYYVELCSRRQPEIVRLLLTWPCWSPTASRRLTGTACRRRLPPVVTQASSSSSSPLIGRWRTRSSWSRSWVRRQRKTTSSRRLSALCRTLCSLSFLQCCCAQVIFSFIQYTDVKT